MKTDVPGRVRNVNLPSSRPLLPLFEAIINSIHAIEDAHEPDGVITVRVYRDTSPLLVEVDKGTRDILSFEIIDNGIGFNEENYVAFQTSDTTYKADRGGKGIGRFVWLVAFEEVEIESTFQVRSTWKTRSFKFVPRGDGIASERVVPATTAKRETRVQLRGFKDRFREAAPKKLETIGAHIVEHCLEYLIRPTPPQVTLIDDATKEKIDLNDLFDKEMAANASNVRFKLGDVASNIVHVRLYATHIKDHLLHYCASSRVVKSERLAGRVPDLAKRLVDQEGRDFVYAGYVDSPILDGSVNQERTDFAISTDESNLFPGPTWVQIRDAALARTREYLSPFTTPVREQKKERIDRFLATEAPMYRPIIKYVEDQLGLVDPDIDDDELDLTLYRAYHDLQVTVRVKGRDLLNTQDATKADFDQFSAQFDDYFKTVGDINKADLARYVFHRKLVLEFLQRLLARGQDGSYALERQVHSLIFPMGTTSDDVSFDRHNLWLLDERLAYHTYLASDKPLRSVSALTNQSKKELDLIVFDKACAFASSEQGPFQTVTIIEFKRPMRKNYPESDNPFDQILEYIDDIRNGKARTADGRDVPVSDGVHFYCYIVADKTELLERQAYKAELEKTPDNQGFFGYKKHYRAYIEFISYTKLLTDAHQRNKAFFDKLGLPAVLPSTSSRDAEEGIPTRTPLERTPKA